MYRSRKKILASEQEDTRFDDGMKSIKDDFDYLVDTFDKINRDGRQADAIAYIQHLSDFMNDMISEAANFEEAQ